MRLKATALDDQGKSIPGRPVAWGSSDTAVILVAPTGDIKTVGPGTATITAQVDHVVGAVDLTAFAITFVTVAAGGRHGCGLSNTGDVYCWGENTVGQLGVGTTDSDPHPLPQRVPSATTFRKLFVGPLGTCAVADDDNAYCWGNNLEGQLGTGSTALELNATPMAGGRTFDTIALASDHGCGLTTGGETLCWGSNDFGQLGDGSHVSSAVPVAVTMSEQVVEIAAGYGHSCAVTAQGSTYCWGDDAGGQLGHDTTYASLVPVPITPDPGLSTLSAGPSRSCGLDAAGTTYCWGFKRFHHAGWRERIPTAEVTTIPLTTVSEGWEHSCGLTAQGEAYCWGANTSGQLGHGVIGDQNVNYRARPVVGGHTFRSIDAGGFHTCGITTTWEALCWGDDPNATGNSSAPPGTATAVPTPVSGGHTFVHVAAGSFSTCAIDASGAAYCWGYGALGNPAFSPPQSSPVPVVGGVVFQSLDFDGSQTACGLSTAGEAYCWGSAFRGALGDGRLSGESLVPVPVSGGHTFSSLSGGRYRSCALTPSGEAWCWGENLNGANGDGTTQHSAVPVRAAGGWSFREIAPGSSHTCGLTTAGSTLCWGNNYSGQLGNGVTTDSPIPVAVVTTETFGQIGAAWRSTCGIATTNRLFCWPSGASGHPGPYPTNLVFQAISMSFGRTCGVTTIGTAYCWDESNPDPSRVHASFIFASVGTGTSHTCSMSTTGTAYCWGDNWKGRLGNPHGMGGIVPDPIPVLGQLPPN
jgi:alpha-tubulin suppressor-like RCC1 family protein